MNVLGKTLGPLVPESWGWLYYQSELNKVLTVTKQIYILRYNLGRVERIQHFFLVHQEFSFVTFSITFEISNSLA